MRGVYPLLGERWPGAGELEQLEVRGSESGRMQALAWAVPVSPGPQWGC